MILTRGCIFKSISILIAIFIWKTDGSAILIESFEDPWDYRLSPHKDAMLSDEIRHHILPPINRRREKENPEPAQSLLEAIVQRNPDLNGKLGDSVRAKVPCSVCNIGVTMLQGEVRKGKTWEEIRTKFISTCVILKIETLNVCTGIFDVFAPDVLPALNLTQLGPKELCSLCLGETCGDVPNPLHEWEVTFPPNKKPPIKDRPPPQGESQQTFKVLHLSDTHYDQDYKEGSVSNCEEPLCCRSYSPAPKTDEIIPAGKWGSYKCDAPKALIDNMLKNIVLKHPDIDYIIWTGDLPPHDIWNQTKKQSLQIMNETVRQMLDTFPGIPIFPALGNHEGIPAGSFPPSWVKNEDNSISWLYNELVKEWDQWLPSTVLNNTILQGGFYSVLIRPRFRLISLNTNYCHSLSWWLLVNSTDPAKELQWLIYELQEAENNGEKVHIIGHIPPGANDCMKTWSRNYYAIVERYESTITAQFFGHTHTDEFEVFYDTKEFKRPTSVAYLGPSVTTYEDHNPAYRIYFVDGDHKETTREVIDHETWTTDLEKANSGPDEPEWYRLYSVKESYGFPTLRPKEWSKLIDNMVDDDQLFDLFFKFYHRDCPVQPQCDKQCKLHTLCDLKCGRSQDRHHLCHDLEMMLGS